MANLRDIRNRIETVKSTQQITKAMKMVAAARLKKAQDKVVATRPYAAKLKSVISKLSQLSDSSGKYTKVTQDSGNTLLIVVGSDRGLCGGFNSNLFKFVEEEIRTKFYDNNHTENLSIVCVGRKANDFFKKKGYCVIRNHNGFFDRIAFDVAASIIKKATDEFLSGEFDKVYLAFNEFKTVITQNRVMDQILPFSSDGFETEAADGPDYLFEPSSSEILESIIPLHLNTQFWRAVLESNASEQGARMAAMDNATENAAEIIRELRLRYNQARQAAITTEISEIVSGAEALKN